MINEAPLIVGIGGTVRAESTSGKALAAALRMAARMGMRTKIISGAALNSALKPFEANGNINDIEVAKQLQMVVSQVVEFAQRAQIDRAAETAPTKIGVQ